MYKHGFPREWSTLKKLIWLQGSPAMGENLPWSEFTGNPVSFDAPKAHVLKSLKASFSPIQDLHGYSNPWPAGGGKNKCYIEDFTATLAELSVSAVNNVLTLSGTNTSTIGANNDEWKHIKFSVTEAGRYAISFSPSLPTGLGYYVYDSAMNTVPLYANVPVGDYTIGIYIPANTALNATVQFQIEAGTTATSFAPYKNECPISGWNSLDIFNEPDYDPTAQPMTTLSFPSTVYGGTAEVAEGGTATGSDEWYFAKMSDFTWSLYSGYFRTPNTVGSRSGEVICSRYKTGSAAGQDKTIRIPTSSTRLVVEDSDYSTAEEFVASFTDEDTVCIKRETPVPFTVTASDTPTAVQGINTMWTDGSNLTILAKAKATA